MLKELQVQSKDIEEGKVIEIRENDKLVNTIKLGGESVIPIKQIHLELSNSMKENNISANDLTGSELKVLANLDSKKGAILHIYKEVKQEGYYNRSNYIPFRPLNIADVTSWYLVPFVWGRKLLSPTYNDVVEGKVGYLEWKEHESWKTFKLVHDIPIKAVEQIKKRSLKTLPTLKLVRKTSEDTKLVLSSPTHYLDLIARYLTAYDADLFSDTVRLLATNIYDQTSVGLIRGHFGNIAKFRTYNSNTGKVEKFLVYDGNINRCLSRATYSLARKMSYLKYNAYNQYHSNLKRFIQSKFVTQDEQDANIFAQRILLETSLINSLAADYPLNLKGGQCWVPVIEGEVKIEEFLDSAESNLQLYMEQARIYYLRGRLALINTAIINNFCSKDYLTTDKDGLVHENEEYSLEERNLAILKVFHMFVSSHLEGNNVHLYDALYDRVNLVHTVVSNSILNDDLSYYKVQAHEVHKAGRNKVKVMDVRFYKQEKTILTVPKCRRWSASTSNLIKMVDDLIQIRGSIIQQTPVAESASEITGFGI